MIAELIHFKKELRQELVNILQYWMQYAVDDQHGGFYGKIDNDNNADADAPKGLVLNARILWAFSAAYDYTGEKKYSTTADRAFRYLIDRFSDQQYGGYYWSIDKEGNIIDGKKQVYGIAFCLYGFSEYYKATKNSEALEQSKNCYTLIEKYSWDKAKGGYLEALTRHWHPIDDLRLSAKDANEKKTMNTHLHVLEAYTNLCRI
ncbi:MAG: AGE family epimerase/isomerase, partial [Chitinophagaceae bacterium]